LEELRDGLDRAEARIAQLEAQLKVAKDALRRFSGGRSIRPSSQVADDALEHLNSLAAEAINQKKK
jgi:outer membrane protein TolC